MKKLGKALGGLAIVGAVAAGGTAFTDSNTVPATTAGYATSTVTGVTASSIVYTLDATGENVTTVVIKTLGNTENIDLGVAFGTDNLSLCGEGTYDTTTYTDYSCTLTVPEPVEAGADALHVSAINE